MTPDYGLWNALVSTATLIVVGTASVAAFRQLRHVRNQTMLAAFLKILDDWRDPAFQKNLAYVRAELPARLRDPGFLDDLDAGPADREHHPELNVCDWYEQIGSYLKYGMLDEKIMMDVSSSSCNTMWSSVEPVVRRMRRTRGNALYENFEYMAARGVLFQRAHPHGCYPKGTPRMDALGAHAYGGRLTLGEHQGGAEPA